MNAAADTTGGDCHAGTGAGDTISFGVIGTIILTASNGTLMLTKNATMHGPGATTLTVDGNNTATVFTMTGNTTASIGGLTIQHGSGNSGGGGIDNSGTLQVTDSIVAFNTSTGSGSFVAWAVVSLVPVRSQWYAARSGTMQQHRALS